MEFIRDWGDSECPTCHRVDDQRIVYNQFFQGRQIFLFVCNVCGEWVQVSLSCEPVERIKPEMQRRLKEPDYGTTWER